MPTWNIALPMYAISPRLREANAAFLQVFIDELRALGWHAPIQIIEPRFDSIDAHWRDPYLLLSQTCGYPLMTRLHQRVQLLAVPSYQAEGFAGSHYRSRLIVPQHSPVQTLADLRGAVAVINNPDSHSGMNALRHAVAPLAVDGSFFSAVRVSGSHVASIEQVRCGQAAVAAIDPVTWAHLLDEQPQALAPLRTLGWSAPAPGLPLVGSRALSARQLAWIRTALAASLVSAPELAQRLRLEGFGDARWHDYQRILEMAEQPLPLQHFPA